jgi:serine protease Do
VIEMRGNGLDPYMVLFDGNGRKVAEDDDGGGGKNARIAITLPSTGKYTLYANSYEVGDTGAFTLSGTLRNNFTAESPPESNNNRRILLEKNGVLNTSSRIFARDGSLFEAFSFNGQAGQIVQIDLISGDFHPYLVLFAPNSKLVKENNGLPSRKNASMTVELPVTGTYRAIVNAFDRTGKGAYKLIVKRIK